MKPASGRNVVIGKNSAIWRVLSRNSTIAERFPIALSHRDMDGFSFTPEDIVWVFAYSRVPAENERLLARLADAGIREAVYISTATTNVVAQTSCYEYPSVKLRAETQARSLLDARILTIGVVFGQLSDLPGGETMATSYDRLIGFLSAPHWPAKREDRTLLFERVSKPFGGKFEKALFVAYGFAMKACLWWPCILRPIDMLLRGFRYRWYGYLFLSNKLWTSTIS